MKNGLQEKKQLSVLPMHWDYNNAHTNTRSLRLKTDKISLIGERKKKVKYK